MLSYQLNKHLYSAWQKDTRFYLIELCQDLWGNWLLKRTWGSATKKDFGRSNFTVCPDYETGVKLYHQAKQRRLSRGYKISDRSELTTFSTPELKQKLSPNKT